MVTQRLRNLHILHNNVDCCHFFLKRSYFASTFLLLSDATSNLIIKQLHINLASLPPRNLYRPVSQTRSFSEKSTPGYFRPTYRSRKHNDRAIPITHHPGSISPNTHCPGNRSPRNSGKTTQSMQTSVTVTQAAAPSAQPATNEGKPKRQGVADCNVHTIMEHKRECASLRYHHPVIM